MLITLPEQLPGTCFIVFKFAQSVQNYDFQLPEMKFSKH